MLVSGGADLADQFERIRVVHQHLIEFNIGHIEQAILTIDGQRAWRVQSIGNNVYRFVSGIEHQNVTQAGIGNEQTIAVVHR